MPHPSTKTALRAASIPSGGEMPVRPAHVNCSISIDKLAVPVAPSTMATIIGTRLHGRIVPAKALVIRGRSVDSGEEGDQPNPSSKRRPSAAERLEWIVRLEQMVRGLPSTEAAFRTEVAMHVRRLVGADSHPDPGEFTDGLTQSSRKVVLDEFVRQALAEMRSRESR